MNKLYAKDREIAELMNMSLSAFKKNVDILVSQYGFPPIDPVINQRYLPAVHEWSRKRNENLQKIPSQRTQLSNASKENLDAL